MSPPDDALDMIESHHQAPTNEPSIWVNFHHIFTMNEAFGKGFRFISGSSVDTFDPTKTSGTKKKTHNPPREVGWQ